MVIQAPAALLPVHGRAGGREGAVEYMLRFVAPQQFVGIADIQVRNVLLHGQQTRCAYVHFFGDFRWLQIIVHEAAHLVFKLVRGYAVAAFERCQNAFAFAQDKFRIQLRKLPAHAHDDGAGAFDIGFFQQHDFCAGVTFLGGDCGHGSGSATTDCASSAPKPPSDIRTRRLCCTRLLECLDANFQVCFEG